MKDTAPWLRPWKEVRDLFLKQALLRERVEREALAAGINCRLKEQKPCS